MWETIRLSTWGNFSLRKIALLFITVVSSALFMAIAQSTTTFAQAVIDGNTLTYNNQQYTKKELTLPNTKPGDQFFVGTPNAQGNTPVVIVASTPDTENDFPGIVRYFNVDPNGNFNAPDPPQADESITIGSKQNDAGAGSRTGCAVEGVGWIICSTSRFIAGGMDKIYEWINGFLTVKPLTTDTTSGLYQAWEIARGIANACFILAFLVIIYSQITSMGINNYEIKKMVPKLIVAAVLVNVSYYICGVAVDASNILGDSVQQALIDVRNSLPGAIPGQNNGGANWMSFENITEYVLSGGTLGIAGVAGLGALATATGGSAVSLIFLLFPVLVAGVLSVLVAVIILAARQAIITVLIVVAPLAFVAYLLPNTEKWFEKWRGLFTTMLLVFPLFSLLFGGSQLAASLIIQNTDQASVVILALFIQVAPLVITPFLIQFSGSLLGRLAGMVNNPQKGLLDSTKNWSKERSDLHAERAKAKGEVLRNPLSPRRRAFKREMNRRNREDQKKLYTSKLDAAWADDDRSHQLGVMSKRADLRKDAAHSETERAFNRRLNEPGNKSWQQLSARKMIADEEVKALQQDQTAAWEAIKSDKMQPNNRFRDFQEQAKAVQRSQKIAEGQAMFAQSEQSDEWAKMVLANEGLQAQIGGIGGSERALARATSEFRKNYGDRIGEGKAVLDHYNLSGEQRQAYALGHTIGKEDGYGNFKVFQPNNAYMREAAIDTQVRQGTVEEIEAILKESGSSLHDYRTTISSAVAEAKVSQKMVYAGGQAIDMLGQGTVVGEAGLDGLVRSTVIKGKIGAADLANNDVIALKRMARVLDDTNAVPAAQQVDFARESVAVRQAAYEALTNPNLKGVIKKNARDELNRMIKANGARIMGPDGQLVVIDTNRDY